MRLGVLGGGQLGRMMALAAYPLGVSLTVLDPAANASAGQVTQQIVARLDDRDALEQLARASDVVTAELEHVPVEAAELLAQRLPVRPGPEAFALAQDRLREKQLFAELEIPTPDWRAVESLEGLATAVEEIGLPAVVKTRRLGYDGKGQVVVRAREELAAAWESIGEPSVVEPLVAFGRELSVLAVRGADGATAFYPLAANRHEAGILRVSLAPAPRLTAELEADARAYAGRILDRLGYVGVLALELFEAGERLLANEVAPRVHNSGHWTIEGAETSQFENHVRAVLGLPLGPTDLVHPCVMVNLVGSVPERERVLAVPGAHLHLYGKEPRPGRKLGHVTVRTEQAAGNPRLRDLFEAAGVDVVDEPAGLEQVR